MNGRRPAGGAGRHGHGGGPPEAASARRLVLVGMPNVGKSLLFNGLTGAYASVSNYPGTTVEVMRGLARIGDERWEVVDTPGMYSLVCRTEEERVARRIVLDGNADVVLHVVDAKDLARMLSLTLQLLEADLPLILVLNMLDEAEAAGIVIDVARLRRELGIPVVGTVATTGRGLDELRDEIRRHERGPHVEPVRYGNQIESDLEAVSGRFRRRHGRRALALLHLQGDPDACAPGDCRDGDAGGGAPTWSGRHAAHAAYLIATERRRRATRIAESAVHGGVGRPKAFAERLDAALISPWTGVPILIAVLYVGLFLFVGSLGAGVVVNLIEGRLFEGVVNPFVESLCRHSIPWAPVRDLVAGDYGVVTLGLRYAVGIILPIVTFFFLVFSVMEDTGYLPRLALLVDRVFKKIGLSGRGIIPITLGFGCGTMATLVTRTLPTVRERVIATMLLALAVPCSAQLGVVLALLNGHPLALLIWAGVCTGIFLAAGCLASTLMPGAPPHFYMELPPLRWPKARNILMKTWTRLVWYFLEILPLFLLVSVLIWLGRLTGVFDWLIRGLAGPVRAVGLPADAAKVFLLGFFRRDYGAAGLYDLHHSGVLNGVQVTVAAVALTLFLPCLAQLLIMVKERGLKTGVAISLFVLAVSFGVAFALNAALTWTRVVL